MPLKRDDITRALCSKGFKCENKAKHDIYRYYDLNGQLTEAFVQISRGTQYRDYSDNLVASCARQARIKKPEFVNLVTCSLSRVEYNQLLQAPQ